MIHICKKRKILKFALALLVLSSSVFASEFCFNKNRPIHLIRFEIKSFLVEGETAVINSHQNCLEVKTRPERAVFVSKLIHSNFSNIMVASTKSLYGNGLCKLKFKEITKVKDKVTEDISDLVSTEGRKFDLDLGGELVSFICNKKSGQYVLDLSKKSKKSTTSLALKMGSWVDLSAFSELEGKEFSLMAVE